jgi:hypothetical protein
VPLSCCSLQLQQMAQLYFKQPTWSQRLIEGQGTMLTSACSLLSQVSLTSCEGLACNHLKQAVVMAWGVWAAWWLC